MKPVLFFIGLILVVFSVWANIVYYTAAFVPVSMIGGFLMGYYNPFSWR